MTSPLFAQNIRSTEAYCNGIGFNQIHFIAFADRYHCGDAWIDISLIPSLIERMPSWGDCQSRSR